VCTKGRCDDDELSAYRCRVGLIRLRGEDIALARDDRHGDAVLDCDWSRKEAALLDHFEHAAQWMGLAVVNKPDLGTSLSRMSTTYYRELRLGTGYADKTDAWKAVTMAHEILHARQWRHWGPATFRTRYMFWTRWRWAIEVQAYRESVRCLVALGVRPSTLDEYIASRPGVLWSKYAIKTLHKGDVFEHTMRLLTEARVIAEAKFRITPPAK
jgi:hypothetical protein